MQELAAKDDKPRVVFRTIVEAPRQTDDILDLTATGGKVLPMIDHRRPV